MSQAVEPGLSIGDATIKEGNRATRRAIFTVSLSPASTKPVTVDYATANGTAAAGSDYLAKSGTLAFPPGTTTQRIVVHVLGDKKNEPNETFFVNLSNATNATIADGQGRGTIHDDDRRKKTTSERFEKHDDLIPLRRRR